MLLKFEEINSTIETYLNDIESYDDKELEPQQSNRTIDHQNPTPIEKSYNVHNGGIQTPTLNLKKFKFAKELNGIYNPGEISGVGSLKDANSFISTGENSNRSFSFPTATLC